MARLDGGRQKAINKGNAPAGTPVAAAPPNAPEAFGRGEPDGDEGNEGASARDERGQGRANPQRPGAKPRNGDQRQDEPDNQPGDGHEPRQPVDYAADDQPKKPPFYKRPLVLVIGGVLLLATIGVGIWYWLYSRQYETTDDAFIDAHITAISPKVAGLVLDIPADIDDNRPVKAGQTLLQIDARDFEQQIVSAEAGVQAAQGKLEQAHAQEKVAEAQAASARADVLTAEANAKNAASDLERYTKLDPRAVSKQALDNATAAAASSQANLEASRKKADAADAQVKFAATQIRTAEADVKTAEATLSNAKLQRSYTTIAAPIAGKITRKDVEKGMYVQVGQALLSIVPPEVYVTANYKETQLTHMHEGDRVDIEVDAFPGRKFRGHVDSIQKGSGARFSLLPPENATGNYVKVVQRVPVKIIFDEKLEDLQGLGPGMSASPRVSIHR